MAINIGNIRRVSSVLGNLGVLKNIPADPQKSYMWEISFSGDIAQKFGDVRFYAKTINIPNSIVDNIPMNYMGNKVFHAGKNNSSHTINITFWDDEFLTIHRYMETWMNLINQVNTGKQVSKYNYTGDLVITMKHNTNALNNGTIKLEKVYPIEISEIPLTYESSDSIEVSAIFSFDTKIIG